MFISTDNILIKKWWAIFILVDVLLIAFTIAHPHLPDFSQKWRLITPFSLHVENNIAVWWSGMTILLAALLFLNRFKQSKASNRISWLAISAIMIILSIDEIGSIHERVGLIFGWAGIFPFALILAGLLVFAILNLLKLEDTRVNAVLIIIAFSIYGSVALQEFIEHSYQWKTWMLGIRVGIEEGSELLATFLMIYAAIKKDKEELSILSIIPDPNTFSSLRSLATLGLVIHIIGSYLFIEFGDPFHRGNPMNWLPTSFYFCTAFVCFYKLSHATNRSEVVRWGILATLFIISSTGIMTNLFIITIPGIYELTSTTLNNESYMIVYIIQLLAIGLLLSKKILIPAGLVFPSLLLIFALAWLEQYIENTWLRYSILGALSYWTFYIFTSKNILMEKYLSSKQQPRPKITN